MSKPFIILSIVTVATASASVYLSQELRNERQQTETLQARITDLQHEIAATPIATSSPPTLETDSDVASAPATAKAPAQVAATVTPAGAGWAAVPSIGFARASPMDPDMRRRMQESHEQQLRLLQNPEYRELIRTQQRMGMQQMHTDLEALLGLSAEERDQLLDVLAEQSIRGMEQRPAFFGPGTPATDAQRLEYQRAFEEQRRRNESEVQAVLGAKYSEWQQYQQNGWSRSQVTNLRQALSSGDEPLRQDQIKPLVEVLAREQQNLLRPRRGVNANGAPDAQAQLRMAEDWLERTSETHARIRASVSGLLTPGQFAQLERQQQQELKMQEISVRQQRARLEAQARGEIPPDPVIGPANGVVTYSQ